jgi:predicted nucleic acid-binding protein
VSDIVLDASALIVFFSDAPGAHKVRELIQSAMRGDVRLLMSVVNWGEVYYVTWRDRGKQMAQQVLAGMSQFPINIEDANFEAAKLAAEFKAQYALPYADCFAASLARRRNARVVTSDSDFLRVKSQIDIQLI